MSEIDRRPLESRLKTERVDHEERVCQEDKRNQRASLHRIAERDGELTGVVETTDGRRVPQLLLNLLSLVLDERSKLFDINISRSLQFHQDKRNKAEMGLTSAGSPNRVSKR